MRRWIRDFFRLVVGTPQRFLWTAAVAGLIVVAVNPGLLRGLADRLIAELSPLLGYALTILIVLGGLRLILFGRK